MSNNRPCLTLSAPGGVQVSIWKNRSSKGSEYFSAKISRRFRREGSDDWESTDYLSARDWPVAAALLQQAFSELGVTQYGLGLRAPASDPSGPSEPGESNQDGPEPDRPF